MGLWNRKYDENYAVYGHEGDGAINKPVLDRIDYVLEDTLLHDDTVKWTDDEMRDLSELYRMALNMDKKQIAVIIAAAIEKEPYLIYQMMAEEFNERGKSNGRRY